MKDGMIREVHMHLLVLISIGVIVDDITITTIAASPAADVVAVACLRIQPSLLPYLSLCEEYFIRL